jgi:hypothetical protein
MTTATMARNGQMAQVSAWGSLYQMLMEALHGLDEAHERFAQAQAQAKDAAAEWTGEVMFGDIDFTENKAAQKNAETRDTYMAMRLARAKQPGGELHNVWMAWQVAREGKVNAAAALEVATRALHGVQYRVDALSNLVRGVQA